MKWKIHQMDVKMIFINGFIEEEVYIEQPQGFETDDREAYVCKLKKALYGLKASTQSMVWKNSWISNELGLYH